MDIQLYNTLTRTKEVFKPIKNGEASMYHCGPTVYDTPHIGNYRTFFMNDLIRRVFEFNDYKVNQVMNITDVDDKTIRRSHEENISLKELTNKYEKIFLEGLSSMNILLPHKLTHATEYISKMIDFIDILLTKKVAYIANDGIYLCVEKVKNYGNLAHLDLSKFTKERIVNDEYNKNDARDFAVWKFKTDEDGEIFWNATFGDGRPGWHIECSAMSISVLGPTIDIHTGGMDLIFPHHTNEIAQSESVTNKTFVNYWVHGGFINVNEEKMAKSKNNFLKLEDLLTETISPLAYRYWLMTAHYRSPVNFTFDAIRASQNALIKLISIISTYPDDGMVIEDYRNRFIQFINDDLNTASAIALTWELIKDANIKPEDKRATLLDFDKVFGLKLDVVQNKSAEIIPEEILALADARKIARTNKDWEQADALRKEIESRGYTVKDTDSETIIQEL